MDDIIDENYGDVSIGGPLYTEDDIADKSFEFRENERLFEFARLVEELSGKKERTKRDLQDLEDKWLDMAVTMPEEELDDLVSKIDSKFNLNEDIKEILNNLYSKFLGWDFYPPDIKKWDDKQVSDYLQMHTALPPSQWGAPKEPWSESPMSTIPYHEVAEAAGIISYEDLVKISKLADKLDSMGLQKEADALDGVLIAFATPSSDNALNWENVSKAYYITSPRPSPQEAAQQFCTDWGPRTHCGNPDWFLRTIFSTVAWPEQLSNPTETADAQRWVAEFANAFLKDGCPNAGGDCGAATAVAATGSTESATAGEWYMANEEGQILYSEISREVVVAVVAHGVERGSMQPENWKIWSKNWPGGTGWKRFGCTETDDQCRAANSFNTDIAAAVEQLS